MTGLSSKIVVVGGAGALGRRLVETLLADKCQVVSVDLRANEATPHNVLIRQPLTEPANLEAASQQASQHGPFSAVFVVAGGWQGGAVSSPSLFASTLSMWEMNVLSALVGARIACSLLPQGLLVMTSAKASLTATPGTLGYGMAKAATNQLVKSLAAEGNTLPEGVSTLAILPEILDTPANREAMGKGADLSSWTPIEVLAEKLKGWALSPADRPPSGSLVAVTTRNAQTCFEVVPSA